MRQLPPLLVLLLLAIQTNPVQAQETAGESLLWDDPAGDQEVGFIYARDTGGDRVAWTNNADALGWYRYLDLVEAGITESLESLRFHVRVQDTSSGPGEPQPIIIRTHAIQFEFHDEVRRAAFHTYTNGQSELTFFALEHQQQLDDRTVWSTDLFQPATKLPEGDGWFFDLPKNQLLDSSYVPARMGDVLSGIRVEAGEAQNSPRGPIPCPEADPNNPGVSRSCGATVYDGIKDGDNLGDFTLRMAPPNQGHLMMRTATPLRASNGLATTYVYDVELHNLGDVPDQVAIQLGHHPASWQMHHPTKVTVAPKSSVIFPVAITVPFAHVHGAVEVAILRAASTLQPGTTSEIVVGVIWTEIPQPAGHHATLHIHGGAGGSWAWMNTALEDQANGAEPSTPIQSYQARAGPVAALESMANNHERHTWKITLRPGLGVGLDFDLQGQITPSLNFLFPYGFVGEAEAELWLLNRETGTPLSLGTGTTPVEFNAGEPKLVVWEFAPTPEAERIPFEPHLNLMLSVAVEGAFDPASYLQNAADLRKATRPSIQQQGSTLTLPLFDYHDEVDLSKLPAATISLDAVGPTWKKANPGKTAAFTFNVTNHGNREETLTWSVGGPQAEWGAVSPIKTTVAAGKAVNLVVEVAVPANAREEDVGEVLITGQSTRDAFLQVFSVVQVDVTLTEEIADESELARKAAEDARAQQKKDAPSVAALAPLLVAMIVVARYRRRHA